MSRSFILGSFCFIQMFAEESDGVSGSKDDRPQNDRKERVKGKERRGGDSHKGGGETVGVGQRVGTRTYTWVYLEKPYLGTAS